MTMTLRPWYVLQPCSAVNFQQPAQCMQGTCSGFLTGMHCRWCHSRPVRQLGCTSCLQDGHTVPLPRQ